MSRSPLAYPLNRGADMDLGGAADLQTDVMRFMAILSLCLVAIFALVQSMPIAPPAETRAVVEKTPASAPEDESPPVTLTRPESIPPAASRQPPLDSPQPVDVPPPVEQAATVVPDKLPPASAASPRGFTLRFESDAALTRLVASSQVAVYAIAGDRAQRMTVAASRISFWDASMPNSFHEMDTATVPGAVADALARSGADVSQIRWGVTLPGKLKRQLDALLRQHEGGALVIGPQGTLELESP